MRSLGLLDAAFIATKGLPPQNLPGDDFENYANEANLNGLNLGWCGNLTYNICWSGAYAARNGVMGIIAGDTFESYADSSNLNGGNGGFGFSNAYTATT